MDVDNRVGIDCGSWGWDGWRRAKGGKLGQFYLISNKNDLIKINET